MKDYYLLESGDVAPWSLKNADAASDEKGISCLFTQTPLPGDVSLSFPTPLAPRAMEPPGTLRVTRVTDVLNIMCEYKGWLTITSQNDVTTSATFTPDMAAELGVTVSDVCPDVACVADTKGGVLSYKFMTSAAARRNGFYMAAYDGKSDLAEDVAKRFKVVGGVAFFAVGLLPDGGPWVAASSPSLEWGWTRGTTDNEARGETTDDISKAAAYVFYMREALPSKSLAAVATAWFLARGRRIMWMPAATARLIAGLYEGAEAFSHGIALNPLAAGDWPAGAQISDVELQNVINQSYSGFLAFAEGFTSPLLAWRRQNVPWVTSAKVAEIAINGAATRGNYMDGGKPRPGLYFDFRPEPATSIDVATQLLNLKWARRATFMMTSRPPTCVLLPFVDGGTCNVLKVTPTTRGYMCEALAYAQPDGEMMTPESLTFSVYGGRRAVTAPGRIATAAELAPFEAEGYKVTPESMGGGCYTLDVTVPIETRDAWFANLPYVVGGGDLGEFLGVRLSAAKGIRWSNAYDVTPTSYDAKGKATSAVIYREPYNAANGEAVAITFGDRLKAASLTVTQGFWRATVKAVGQRNTLAIFKWRQSNSGAYHDASLNLGASGEAKVCDLNVYIDDVAFMALRPADIDELPKFVVDIMYIVQNG